MPEVAILGDLNLDIILKLPHEPLPDTSLPAEEAYTALGGVGGNTSLWLKYLDKGIDISLFTGVGEDIVGKELIDGLRKAMLKIGHIKVMKGVNSGVMVVIEYGDTKKIVGFRGANSLVKFNEREIIEVINNVNHAHASGYFALNSDGGELLLNFLKAAQGIGVSTSIDLEGIALMKPEFLHKIKGLVKYALLNKSELRALTTRLSLTPEELLKKLGVEALITKLGEKGAFIYTEGSKKLIKSREVRNVVDPTGAGDAFNAAFILSLIKGSSLTDAVMNACIAGSEAVRILGGSPLNIMLSQASR